MKILLLGKNGMLGSALMGELSDFECEGLGHEDLDITDFDSVSKKFQESRPELVINATGYTNVDKAEEESGKAMLINGEAVGNLAKVCKNIPLLHFSTDYVFKGDKKDGYNENDEPDGAVNIYGESKALGEKLIKENTGKYYIIRTSWLFGENGKNFVTTILRLGQEKNELRIVNDQFGKPTYTKDLAEGIKDFILKKHPFGTYHQINENPTTWYDFAREILELKGIETPVLPIPTSEFPVPAKRPHYTVLNNTKLPHLRPWKQALKDYLKEVK